MFEKILNTRLREAEKIIDSMSIYNAENISKSSLPEFSRIFLLKENKIFEDKKSLMPVLDKSIKLLLNYTLRPKWTLLNFLYGASDIKPSGEIQKKLEYFPFYNFYTDTINEYISDNGNMNVDREIVSGIIDKVNEEILEKLKDNPSSLKIKNFFQQVYRLKYNDITEISLDMSVPYSYIKLFLEDKGFNETIKLFENTNTFRDDTQVELKNAIKVITGKFSSSIDSVFEEVKPQVITHNTDEEEIRKDDKEEQEITKKKKYNPEQQNTYKDTIIYETTFEEQQEKVNIPTEEIDDSQTGSGDNLRYLFKDEEIKIISKKIFNGDRYAMFDFLNQMTLCLNWREATEKLKEQFIKNKVNHYDKSVILFVDILSDYFDKRDR